MSTKIVYHAGDDKEYKGVIFDIEEQRERPMPDGSTIKYLYMHGIFPQNGVKFSFFIPEKESFEGRFFQFLCPFPGPDEENASVEAAYGVDDKVAFALYHGAAYVETNMGSKAMFTGPSEPGIIQKSNGETAELFRKTVMAKYGCKRPYGYAYGGSGGAYKTMTCAEFSDCFDGVIPHVIGSPASLPNTITMHAQGQRVLRNVFGKIIDAIEPGGTGDMYGELGKHEAETLRELTLMGFPPKAWYVEAMGRIDDGSLPVLMPGVKMADPGYFKDFWEIEGYEGSNPDSSAVKDRVVFRSKVKSVHLAFESIEEAKKANKPDVGGVDTAWKKLLSDGARNFIELEQVPTGDDLYLKGTNIIIESGDAKGSEMLLGRIEGNYIVLGMCFGVDRPEDVLGRIKPGDEIRLDNSDYIAIQHYYRHQVPDKSFHAWDQFRGEDGEPLLPQRPNVLGLSMNGTGHPQDGDIQCKTMVIQALTDESTCPWCADWYRNKIKEAKGSEEDFRLYYMENCMHGNEPGLGSSRVVEYMGGLRQMLLDLSDWVEKGKRPIPTTNYNMIDNQVVVPENASKRLGIQPTAELLVNGSLCAHVSAGDEVRLSATAYAPLYWGEIVSMEFSFEDSKDFVDSNAFSKKGQMQHIEVSDVKAGDKVNREGLSDVAISETTHVYDRPGTYFATVRVMSNRNPHDPFTCVKNLARARIVVN